MKLKPIILVVASLTVGGIAYAGYRYFKKQSDLLNQYSVKLINIGVVSMSMDQLVLSFTVRLTNKSDIEATMQEMHADIYINNIYVGFVINDTAALIPAKGTSDIKLQATVSPKIILSNIVDLITASANIKDINYRLNGYVKLKSGFLPVQIPFDDSGKLSDYL